MDSLVGCQRWCEGHNHETGSELRNIPLTSSVREQSELAMGRPIPMFQNEIKSEKKEPLSASNRRPPPLDLSQVPDTGTMDWFATLFENLYRLLKEAEDKYPTLARWHRTVSEALTDTPPSRGDAVWATTPSEDVN